jgi:hypothetical protein
MPVSLPLDLLIDDLETQPNTMASIPGIPPNPLQHNVTSEIIPSTSDATAKELLRGLMFG